MGSSPYESNPYLNPVSSQAYHGEIFTPPEIAPASYNTGDGFEDEPPLMEGIFTYILFKKRKF